jgi:hypothetical protein
MNIEQHWEQLFGYLPIDGISMQGTWTVYLPGKQVIKSAQGIINLRPNAHKTVITHTNQFPSPDGSKVGK